jgi:tetratricopeptide (TPR) repeat protein
LAWKANPNFGNGGLSSLMGSFESAQPGGSLAKATQYFDAAIAISQGKNAGAYIAKAESIALAQGQREAFETLLKQAMQASDKYPDISNDLMRYSDPSVDAMVRDDLAAVLARREDLAFLRGDEDAVPVQPRFADGHAVVEGRGHAQLRQVRAHHPLRGRQPFVEAASIAEPGNALARGTLCEADAARRVAVHGSAAAACARRRLTTAGVAPMSWMATATPASG